MSINFEIKRKITVDGKEYGSLDEVPPEVRTAIFKTMASGSTTSKATIHVNGKTYSSVEDLPAPLRAIVAGMTALVSKGTSERVPGVRPEPVLSKRMIVVGIGVAVLLLWLIRQMF